ncbi:Uncharacterised protein [Legionella hackeliae]|uniref:Uncharacterized protein n=1 Tax=Legionella hackeliae TaxID=449 RepID=A0A0A8UV11_LEGHA|nr:hypothetical protein Lhac_0118 [Legionella hackeliae]CEK11356.1 protein of unknown function [Legionella hackeliae]STX48128.1 Uncharacterised protein [Legionella hackeliae]
MRSIHLIKTQFAKLKGIAKRKEGSSMKTKDGTTSSKSKDIAQSYNKFKEFEGKQYTGMKVGRSQ